MMHALLTLAVLKLDATMPLLTAMIIMRAQLIIVILILDVITPLLIVTTTTPAQTIPATPSLAASTRKSLAMIKMHVLMTAATLIQDVFSPQFPAMTMTHAPPSIVAL
jgi:hypothetical protein